MNKPKAIAGLLMDRHSTHESNDAIELMRKNNVKILFIPSHSSHITQPLDLLIFTLWKRNMKRIYSKKPFIDNTKRLIKGIKALQMSCNMFDITSAGIIITIEDNQRSIKIKSLNLLLRWEINGASQSFEKDDCSIEEDTIPTNEKEDSDSDDVPAIQPKVQKLSSSPIFPKINKK